MLKDKETEAGHLFGLKPRTPLAIGLLTQAPEDRRRHSGAGMLAAASGAGLEVSTSVGWPVEWPAGKPPPGVSGGGVRKVWRFAPEEEQVHARPLSLTSHSGCAAPAGCVHVVRWPSTYVPASPRAIPTFLRGACFYVFKVHFTLIKQLTIFGDKRHGLLG